MSEQPTLTIAVCTRDRPMDVERCVRSIVTAQWPNGTLAAEVIIVDDGRLPAGDVKALERLVTDRGYTFRYVQQVGAHGLIHARVSAIREAAADVLLFLDDDVEIASDYLVLLVHWYRDHPELVGIGGTDVLMGEVPVLRRWFERVFLQDSGAPGELSASGFSGSVTRWGQQRRPFPSAFLSGCNMSFRRAALSSVVAVSWLQGYGLGEDLYLSFVASARGQLWVDPALRVWHHRSRASRTEDGMLSYFTIVNPYRLLRLRNEGWMNLAALSWTIVGVLLKDAVRPSRWRRFPAYVRGIRDAVRDVIHAPPAGQSQATGHPHSR